MIKAGVPLLIVRLLCYWYISQEFYVKWNKCKSSVFLTSNGVRQGGILSPKLFAFYLNELSIILGKLNVGCFIEFKCTSHLFYADDMCILAPSAVGLQLLLNACSEYGYTHDIIFHPIKSSRYKLFTPSVVLNDRVLDITDGIKYLGVSLSSDFKDDSDMKRQLRSLYISSNSILSKFYMCSVSVKCRLIESYSLNFYCSYLWCTYNRESLSKLRVAYNTIYRF